MQDNKPDFDAPELARAIETLSADLIDTLPFGCVRLDANGIVVFYSTTERQLSGSGDRARVGLDFFTQVAPCMSAPAFRGRLESAMHTGRLDLEFGWVGDFDDAQREMRVRIQSATGGGCWIFIQRA
ncbi:MAG: hypothetical protein U1E70_03115 [Acetobacteraceae bacterium]